MSNLFIEDLDRRQEQSNSNPSNEESTADRFREEIAFGSEPKDRDGRGGATTEATGEEGTLPKSGDSWHRASTEATGEEGALPKSGDWRGRSTTEATGEEGSLPKPLQDLIDDILKHPLIEMKGRGRLSDEIKRPDIPDNLKHLPKELLDDIVNPDQQQPKPDLQIPDLTLTAGHLEGGSNPKPLRYDEGLTTAGVGEEGSQPKPWLRDKDEISSTFSYGEEGAQPKPSPRGDEGLTTAGVGEEGSQAKPWPSDRDIQSSFDIYEAGWAVREPFRKSMLPPSKDVDTEAVISPHRPRYHYTAPGGGSGGGSELTAPDIQRNRNDSQQSTNGSNDRIEDVQRHRRVRKFK